MKKSHLYLIILLSILPFLTIFLSLDLPHTSDGGVHVPRLAAYVKALSDGHIPVRWAGDLNYGYGVPLFNFIYHTPYLVGSLFVGVGASLVTSFKLILFISFLLSGLFMYLFAHTFFRDARLALLITVLYQFAPFRLVEVLIRGSIGGLYAYAFFPLVLYGLTRIMTKPNGKHVALTAGATAFLVISHNSLSLVFFGICALFAIVFGKSWRIRIVSAVSLALGLGLAGFYWIPALLEHKYTYGNLHMKDLFRTHFPPVQNFLIPNVGYWEQLRTAEISVQLGIVHIMALLSATYLLYKNKLRGKEKTVTQFALGITILAFFVMLPLSLPLWERIPLLRQFQFPWRMLGITSFTTALLGVGFSKLDAYKNARFYWIVIAFTVLSTIYYWQPLQGYDRVDEADFWNYPLNTTYFGETDVIWSAGPASDYPPARAEVIAGNATITNFDQTTVTHMFEVEATSEARIVDHVQYFPGWRVYVNGEKVPIEFQDQNWRGLITFAVPEGNHPVRVAFEESKLRLASNVVSLGSLIIVAGIGILARKKTFT